MDNTNNGVGHECGVRNLVPLNSQPSCSYSADTESETGSDTDHSSSNSSIVSLAKPSVSLLDRLRAPAASVLALKQKVGVNVPPPNGKNIAWTGTKSPICMPKRVTPLQRVSEFLQEQLVSAGKLFL